MASVVKTIKLSDYVNTRYRDYSIYVNNERAIPNITDGLKPVQRKILFAATKECEKDYTKISSLAGSLAKIAAYHHGSEPAEKAIIRMAQDFNQNYTLLDYEGTFGTRPIPSAGAARYIFVKLSDRFNELFKDNDILEYSLDKEDRPEPINYLPIVPPVLLNGAEGMAIGFAVKILPRSLEDVTNACIEYVKSGKTKPIIPNLSSFHGQFVEVSQGKYECLGAYKKLGDRSYHITDLPISMKHEKFEKVLETISDKHGIIKKVVDDTSDTFDYTITLNKNISEEEFVKLFKLKETITENYSLIDDTDSRGEDLSKVKIRKFDTVEDVIKFFCDYRIQFYQKRIDYRKKVLEDGIFFKEKKIEFIDKVMKKQIDIVNVTKKQLRDIVIKDVSDMEIVDRLISMPVYSMTKDSIERLRKEIRDAKEEIDWWNKQTPKGLYLKNLRQLLKSQT